MDVVRLKEDMRAYAVRHRLVVPRVMWKSGVWGAGARTLAWRVSGRYGKATTDKAKLWLHFHPAPAPIRVQHPIYRWASTLDRRSGKPPGIVWHHAAGTGSALDIHHAHLRIGDRGIAYHSYVRRDGSIFSGRPEWAMGAHCLGHNDWLGICAEGNYESSSVMPAAQLTALKGVHRYLHKRYSGIPDRRHKDMSGNATACPGRHFPLAAITK